MKHTIKGYITAEPINYGENKGKLAVSFTTYRPCAEFSPSTVVVREHTFEVDVADNFDCRPGTIANLEKEKERIRNEAATKVMQLDDWIGRLQAIENSAEVSA
ncbi:MAG: hypothetical protein K0S48_29 [Ramlibacter sp.]|jgi:hypothetical protein|nr:hypothetical protein [Ramlibacter sp.]